MKKILIILGLIAAVLLIGYRIKQSADIAAYAAAHNCEWSATGTMYGDDRDWICK